MSKKKSTSWLPVIGIGIGVFFLTRKIAAAKDSNLNLLASNASNHDVLDGKNTTINPKI